MPTAMTAQQAYDLLTRPRVRMRHLIRRDLPEVLRIETASFHNPWGVRDFVERLSVINCIGLVAEHENRVVGYMLYQLIESTIHLMNIVVDPELRRRRIGRTMIDRLKKKLAAPLYDRIETLVDERQVDGQLFLRASGFVTFQTISAVDEWQDGYRFRYRAEWGEGREVRV